MSHNLERDPTGTSNRPKHPALGRIVPARQLRIVPTRVRISTELERVRTIQIGAAVLIGIIGLVAWPLGIHAVSFVFAAGIIIMIIGLLTGRTTVLLRNYLARRRAKKLGEVTMTGGTIVVPRADDPLQFQLEDPHTLLRAWQKTDDEPRRTITSMLIAQEGDRAILYSSEPSSEEEARDYGFKAEESAGFNKNTEEERICLPLPGLHTLSRMIDAFLEGREDS